MKILLIPENYPTDRQPNGAVFMEDQVRVLRELGVVTVFNTNPWHRGAYRQMDGVEFAEFHVFSTKWQAPFNLLAYALWEFRAIKKAKKLPRPDLIHLHGASLRGKMAVKLAKFWKVPLFITEHTGPWSAISGRSVVFAQAKASMEAASCVLPVSHHLKGEILQSGIAPRGMRVLGNPVDTRHFALRSEPLTAHKNILFLGRLDAFKGGLRTLKAFHSTSDRLPGWKLTIAGEGEETAAIKDYILTHNLGASVFFHQGFFDREAMRTFFQRASFLVFPSQFESFGLVGAEAMATGLPVLITDRTGPVDYFSEGCGLQVGPDDVEALAAGMIQIATGIGTYVPLKIRQAIESRFGFSAFAREMKTLYTKYLS